MLRVSAPQIELRAPIRRDNLIIVLVVTTLSLLVAWWVDTVSMAPIFIGILFLAVLAAVAVFSRVPLARRSIAHTSFLERGTMGSLVIAFAGYQLLFNYLPPGGRLQIAGLLAVVTVAFGSYECLREGKLGPKLLAAAIAPTLLTLASAMFGTAHLHASATFRIMFPLYFGASLIARPDLLPRRAPAFAAIAIIVGGWFISLARGRVFVADATRLASFTGGLYVPPHSSAYLMGLAAMILNELRRAKSLSGKIAWPLIVAGCAAIFEYKVATAAVMMGVYFVVRGLVDSRGGANKLLVLALIAILAVPAYQARVAMKTGAKYGQRSASADSLSSGRLQVWGERLQIINSRHIGEEMFGTGTHSDEFYTDVWGGSIKDSHNDFITLFIERGLIGMGAYIVFFALIFRAAGRAALPVLAAVTVASLLSNAMLARPTVAPFEWIAAALAIRASAVIAQRRAAESETGEPDAATT